MKNIFIVLMVIFCHFYSTAQNIIAPESIDFHYPSNTWYISNTINILAMDTSGNKSVFTTDVNNCYGIEVVGDKLFVISGAVKVFNLNSGALEQTINIPDVGFLNGIHYDNSQYVWVTDFTKGNVWKIDVNTYQPTFVSYVCTNPNGIYFDETKQTTYVVSYTNNATIYELESSSNVTAVKTTSNSNFDGITKGCDGNYYVSAWGSQSLLMFDNQFQNAPTTVLTGLNNPSDLFFNTTTNQVAIPNSGNHTLAFFDVNCPITSVNSVNSVSQTSNFISVVSNALLINNITTNSTLQVYSLEGKLLINKALKNQNSVDASILSTGTYIAVLYNTETNERFSQVFFK